MNRGKLVKCPICLRTFFRDSGSLNIVVRCKHYMDVIDMGRNNTPTTLDRSLKKFK